MGINLQKVSFKYSPYASKILKDICLNIDRQDEFIFLIGQTGSGKSTLVQLLNALLLPTSGSINILGKDVVKKTKKVSFLNTVKNCKKYDIEHTKGLFKTGTKLIYDESLRGLRQKVGLVFQFPEYQIFESTVLDDVAFGPKNFGMSKDKAYRHAKAALREVGLDEKFDSLSPFNLSGGELRRVAIAGIIACNPDVLILDEPTVGLDPKGKLELMELLHKIQKETNKSIIIISHDMDIVANNAKRVIVLNKGNIVYDGNKEGLFNNSELLDKYSLGLPQISQVAIELRNKGLVKFNNIPLTVNDLEKCILRGDKNE